MPFHDQESEDLARDCATFPAYTDYLYGPDMRLATYKTTQLALSLMPLQPIRYTNSRPSQNWYYKADSRTKNLASIDLRHHAGSPGLILIPPQFPYPASVADLNNRNLFDQSARQMHGGVSTGPSTVVPSSRQPVGRVLMPIPAFSASRPASRQRLMGSSSATDIDEDHGSRISTSPSAQGSTHVGMAMYTYENGTEACKMPALEHRNVEARPILRPGDVSRNRQFAFIPEALRQDVDKAVIKLWYNMKEPTKRMESVKKLQGLSQRVYQKREEWQKKQQQQARDRMLFLEQASEQHHQRDDHNYVPFEHSVSPKLPTYRGDI
ncbi:hypothetical protein IAQ61_003270 [Plenodomus lingam]|uniref:uncharacterized protein n=1 Tax=Leptosphaeria maculans TaxID=5022 RepID=UPI003320461B|nr:hypothetical protein IAQ61_003270 [Plenodomus lingam]